MSFLHNFYLVGGSGFSLRMVHRNSIYTNLFKHIDYSLEELSRELSDLFGNSFQKIGKNRVMLFGYFNNIKVDYINNKIPLIFPLHEIDGIRLAVIKDIAPLKINAIFGRGSKKDFIGEKVIAFLKR